MTINDRNLIDTEPNPVDEYLPEVEGMPDTETGRDPNSGLNANPDIGLGVVDADESPDVLTGDQGPGGVDRSGQRD